MARPQAKPARRREAEQTPRRREAQEPARTTPIRKPASRPKLRVVETAAEDTAKAVNEAAGEKAAETDAPAKPKPKPFETGDLVEIKTGSALMVVVDVFTDRHGDQQIGVIASLHGRASEFCQTDNRIYPAKILAHAPSWRVP